MPTLPSKHTGLSHLPSLSTRHDIEDSRKQVILAASAGINEDWSLLSARRLFVASHVTEGAKERAQTLELLEECQIVAGPLARCIVDQVRRNWM